ncbi:hypothetical protein M0802_010173 [Mischocyttarus mexicanus]|nr:hypothetical protein M0802_010173 [Mischocyttarus mexicanus]
MKIQRIGVMVLEINARLFLCESLLKVRLGHWLLNEVATIYPRGAVQVAGNSWTSSGPVWRVKDPASPGRARFGNSQVEYCNTSSSSSSGGGNGYGGDSSSTPPFRDGLKD